MSSLGIHYLERQGVSRRLFYEVRVAQEGDEWIVLRRWGYVGCHGWRVRHEHPEQSDAAQEVQAVLTRRRREGYVVQPLDLDGRPARGPQLLLLPPQQSDD